MANQRKGTLEQQMQSYEIIKGGGEKFVKTELRMKGCQILGLEKISR